MTLVSVTRLRLRSVRFLPRFLALTWRAARHIEASAGFAGGRLLIDRRLAFWTLTAWESEPAMRAAIMSGDHRVAMPNLIEWCDEASRAHWTQDQAALPTWREAEARMRREGKASIVRHPSPRHADLTFAPLRVGAVAAALGLDRYSR